MTGLRAPLAVRITDGIADRHVSRYASGLKFRKTAPGGFTEASCKVNLPRSTFTALGAGAKIWVYSPTGRVLFEGFIDNPGTADGMDGQSFDLTATGTTILAQDRSLPLIYVDTDYSGWAQKQNGGTSPNFSATIADDPTATVPATATQGILLQVGTGQPIATSAFIEMGYDRLIAAGMELGTIVADILSGKVDSGYRDDLAWYLNSGAAGGVVIPASATGISATASTGYTRVAGDGTLPTGQNRLGFRLRRSGGATNVADDLTWTFLSNVAVLGRRMGIDGTLNTAAAQTTHAYVLAHQVAADLFARLLPVDPNASQIDTSTFPIDALAYPDGVTAGDGLDDLGTYEPGFLWEILESTRNGYRCNYRQWPTTARYEFTVADGYSAPGGDNDLCNRQVVYWTDARGRDQNVVITATSATYPALATLEAAGRTKDADPITLPVGRGSLAAAVQIGTAALADKATAPVAATVTVRRKVVDLLTGNTVSPWDLEPGYLARVRETGDLLRITDLEHDDDAGSTVLTLGRPQLTPEQRIARLQRRSL